MLGQESAFMMMSSAARLRGRPGRCSEFAVLLNANAKQVDGGLRSALERVMPPQDVFLSRSAQDAEAIAETVVERGYSTVFTGGGDGTFVGWVNHILDISSARGVPLPRFGVLALGTGNAVAEVVGARRGAQVDDLRAFASGAAPCVRRLDLLVCDGRRTPFAGVGIDAAVINDYNWLKGTLGDTALSSLATGVPGYGLAVALRSVPRYLLERSAGYCEIVNVGRRAHRLDGRGRQVGRAIGSGEVLYAGPCMMAAASTVPFYGFGLKAFPYAEARAGMLQLRVATQLSVPTVLWNLQRIWSGTFEHPGLLDFHVERVVVRFERPIPLQIGGDAEGSRAQVSFGMDPAGVEMVDFAASARRPRLLRN
jgi:diacylglycerol kinase family enzyme